ncbi:unnamed protein product, partial [Symbiodinium sp. KB8]
LLFEAGTFVVAELRSSVAGDDDGTRKLTHQERSSRMSALRAKLGAWPITGSFEPSNALIDLAFSMVADGAVKYLAPSRCSSREAEVVSDKKDETLFRLEAASFKAARKPPNIRVDVSSELRLYQAFSRRGVALEVANICSFAAHESPSAGKEKTGSPSKQTAVPAALKGLDPNKDGTPICFDCNLAHGCKRETWETAKGKQCEREPRMIPTSAHPCQDADAHHVTPVPVEGSGVSVLWDILQSGAPKGCKVLSVERETEAWLLSIGVPCAPEAFLSHAAAVAHPSEAQPQLPVDLEFTVHCLETCTAADIASKRCQFLHSVLQRASELAPQESALHSRLAPHCQRVLAGKCLLLLKELLKGLGHEDVSLVEDICSGFRLTGWLPLSHVMEPKITAPSESAADLWRRRRDTNSSIWRQTQPGKGPEVDSALWQATLDDAEAGWALLLPQSDRPPDAVLLSRRFPVVQASGIRAIDDFSVNGLNSTLGTCEKVLTMSTVHTVSLALRLLRSAVTRGLKLLGRCFDLKKAYRQLPIHLDDLPYAAVSVWSTDDLCPRVLQMFSLPFGFLVGDWP